VTPLQKVKVMMPIRVLICALLLLAGLNPAEAAGVATWTDDDGIVHIEDRPATDQPRRSRDLQAQLTLNFPPQNAVEKARNATVLVQSSKGVGSGFFITKDGFILTNRLIVNPEGAHKIVLIDGTQLEVQGVKEISEKCDIALLKLDGYQCPYIEPFDARRLSARSSLFAIGMPMGLTHTISPGIYSGIKSIDDMNYIQTTAAVTYINSGGPLVTQFGRVVGVNTQKLAGQGGEGLNYAVSVYDMLAEFKKSLGEPYKHDQR
jgi:S1-C subfamily serine protease